jgi:mannobiose 2-epimerase
VRLGADPARALAAQRAWDWVRGPLTDPLHGGVYWSVDSHGQPLADHKQTYAQAFNIYALTACHAWQCTERQRPLQSTTPALQEALHLFDLLDEHARDNVDGGYFEGCTRDWQVLPGAKLSELEPPAPKSTNTTLHVLEAYTELLRCYPKLRVAARLRELIDIFLNRLWLPKQRCFGLFFTNDWKNLTPQVSWGHDIEAAWLLVRAAQVLGDPLLLQRVQALALEVAEAVLRRGVDGNGRLLGAGLFDGSVTDRRSHWWCQAEAMVGFWDAWQLSGEARFASAAWRHWQFIAQHHVDRQGGDWFKLLDEHGVPMNEVPKAGPWECPYHHVRACLEMAERLAPAAKAP